MEAIEHMLALPVHAILVFGYLCYCLGTISTDNKPQRGRGCVEPKVHQTYSVPPHRPKPRM